MTNLRKGLLAGAAVCAAAVSGFDLPAYAATITEFDPSGSFATYPTAISGGVIAGYYESYFIDGFVRAADGSITTFDAPHATETYPTSINKAGSITGFYTIDSGVEHGFGGPRFNACTDSGGACFFVRTADGVITEFTIPDGFPVVLCLDIYCSTSINDSGAIAGSYYDVSFAAHGFVRSPHGKITTFDPAGSTSTWVTGINRSGMIAGWYNDSNGVHGFVRAPDSSITTFDVPNSINTEAFSINKAGTIAGDYLESGNYHAPANLGFHGFVRSPDGTVITFDPPGSIGYFPVSIADSGVITGTYTDGSGLAHGFIRKKGGWITSFDPPGASQTFPASIDSDRTDKNVITGYYEDGSGNYHGFIRTP